MRGEHAGLVLDTTYAIGYCPPYGRGFGTDSPLSHMCERFPILKGTTTTLTDHTAELYDLWHVRINE